MSHVGGYYNLPLISSVAKNVLFEFFSCKRLEPEEKHSSNPTQDRTLRINLLFRTVRFPDFFNVLNVINFTDLLKGS